MVIVGFEDFCGVVVDLVEISDVGVDECFIVGVVGFFENLLDGFDVDFIDFLYDFGDFRC